MNYLYGDSTPSPLTTNFLEFLRDALDFCVVLLQADERIKHGLARSQALGQEVDRELERLAHFIGVVDSAIEGAEKGGSTSPTAHCAIRIKELVSAAHQQSISAIRNELAQARARIEAEESEARDQCLDALGQLFGAHDPPDGTVSTRIELGPSGTYEGTREGAAAFGVAWALDIVPTEGSPWGMPVRLERLMPHIEISAPQVSGWLNREIKVRPLQINRYVVTELVVDGKATSMKLRTEPGVENGFDVKISPSFEIQHVGPHDDPTNGSFELPPNERAMLEGIAHQLRTHLAFGTRNVLRATTDDAEFRSLPVFGAFVEKLVAMLAPVVREIAQRSLTPTELVIRRLLADDRREEIFVSKRTLRQKLALLDEAQRQMFASLALDDERPQPNAPPREPAASRAEIPERGSTLPPKPEPKPEPKIEPKIEPKPEVKAEPGLEPKTVEVKQPPARPPKTKPPPPPIQISLSDADVLVEEEGIAKELSRIEALAGDEAYKAYAALFAHADFDARKPEEQRAALEKMVHKKGELPKSDAAKEAFRAAIKRISKLAETRADPIFYEMLGVAHQVLDEQKQATTAFEIALKLERGKNPKSALVESLEKRLRA